MKKKYDIIGDIHGYGKELKDLLEKLGYTRDGDGVYVPPEPARKAVFTGDYIDRGAENFEVIDIVRKMVEKGYAHAIMGNHDLNAAMFHTHREIEGEMRPMRPHNAKNKGQHATFLRELHHNPQEGMAHIAWLKSLPVCLEMDGLRFVHAQWHQPSLDRLRQSGVLDDENRIRPDQWQRLAYGTAECDAIEMLTKGTEISINGSSFTDADGHVREKARLKWWANPDDPSLTFDKIVLDMPAGVVAPVPVPDAIKEQMRLLQQRGGGKIFFGHYWQKGQFPTVESDHAICMDQSVAKDGYLAAATLTVEDGQVLDTGFTSVKSRPPVKAAVHAVAL